MKRIISSFIIMFFIAISALSAQSDVSEIPGYFFFGDLSSLDDSVSYKEIKISQELFALISNMETEDPEIKELFSNIRSFNASIFKVTESNAEKIRKKIKDCDNSLTKSDWTRIVQVTGKNEGLNVYVKSKNEKEIFGVVVMRFNKDKEAAFVNIIGDIKMEAIGKLSSKFHFPGFNEMREKKGEKHSDKKADTK